MWDQKFSRKLTIRLAPSSLNTARSIDSYEYSPNSFSLLRERLRLFILSRKKKKKDHPSRENRNTKEQPTSV